jgi:hypothetical protein
LRRARTSPAPSWLASSAAISTASQSATFGQWLGRSKPTWTSPSAGTGRSWTELDRLLNAGHSALHEIVVGVLVDAGWEVVPERSFSWYGERGIIDIVAWHAATRTLLVVELKTEIVDVQRLIGTVDRYRRLAPKAVEDLGWVPAVVGVWVAVADTSTNRRRLAEHVRVLRAAFPTDGRTVPGWLRSPVGALRALSFLSDARVANRIAARSSRRRVRPAREGTAALSSGLPSDRVSRPPST